MKIYELNLHLPTSISENDRTAIWNKIKDLLKKTKSEIAGEVAFKQQELSYPIKKEQYTFFGSLYFKALSETILEIQELLDHEQKILRYMIVTHREVPKKYVPRKRTNQPKTSSSTDKTDRPKKDAPEKDKPVIKKVKEQETESKTTKKTETKEVKILQKAQDKPEKKVTRKQPRKEPKIKLEDIDKSLETLLEKEL